MDVLVARQAVFDRSKKIVAYELLFRSSQDATQSARSDLLASTHVLASGLLDIGLGRLLDGHRALVNVPYDLLLDPRLRALPPGRIAFEILETVRPTDAVLAACRELKKLDFTLVLDDYTGQAELAPLVELVDWVKVDFRLTPGDKAVELAKELCGEGKILVAEKVETEEEFDVALKAGYRYFQGFFLHRPRLVVGRSIPPKSVQLLRLLSLVSTPDELDIDKLESVISQDVGLSLRLIRYSNSARFAGSVSSLRQCLVRLGGIEIRRFVSILALPQLSGVENSALIQQSILRGKMCENLASEVPDCSVRSQAFLAGMFSLLDAIMRMPMREILKEMSLASELEDVLLEHAHSRSVLALLLQAVQGYEAAHMDELREVTSRLVLTMPQLLTAYVEAVEWSSMDWMSESNPRNRNSNHRWNSLPASSLSPEDRPDPHQTRRLR